MKKERTVIKKNNLNFNISLKLFLFVLSIILLFVFFVNNVSAAMCSNYERAVKWGYKEIELSNTIKTVNLGVDELEANLFYNPACTKYSTGIDPNFHFYMDCDIHKYRLFIYKPGGISRSISYTWDGAISFKNINNIDAECGVYEYEKIRDKWGAEHIQISTIKLIGNCYNANQSKSNTNTTDLPSQFIDTMRGELKFSEFNELLNSNGLSLKNVSWQTICVQKDKCADGANNNGPLNIFNVEPYKYYLTNDSAKLRDPSGNIIQITPQNVLNVSLVDIDDPDCKFIVSPNVGDPLPKYNWPTDYRKFPYSNNSSNVNGIPYCLDQDGDGFCGRNASWQNTGSKNIYDPETGMTLSTPVFEYLPIAGKYLISKQFPDCNDDPSNDNWYYINKNTGARLKAGKSTGWKGQYQNTDFGAWNVHPFAPITFTSCAYDVYDTNCNKDWVDGYDYPGLVWGDTPFDFNLSTGIERRSYSDGYSHNYNTDLVCFTPNPKAILREGYTQVVVEAIAEGSVFLILPGFIQVPVIIYGMGSASVDLFKQSSKFIETYQQVSNLRAAYGTIEGDKFLADLAALIGGTWFMQHQGYLEKASLYLKETGGRLAVEEDGGAMNIFYDLFGKRKLPKEPVLATESSPNKPSEIVPAEPPRVIKTNPDISAAVRTEAVARGWELRAPTQIGRSVDIGNSKPADIQRTYDFGIQEGLIVPAQETVVGGEIPVSSKFGASTELNPAPNRNVVLSWVVTKEGKFILADGDKIVHIMAASKEGKLQEVWGAGEIFAEIENNVVKRFGDANARSGGYAVDDQTGKITRQTEEVINLAIKESGLSRKPGAQFIQDWRTSPSR